MRMSLAVQEEAVKVNPEACDKRHYLLRKFNGHLGRNQSLARIFFQIDDSQGERTIRSGCVTKVRNRRVKSRVVGPVDFVAIR